MQFEEGARGFDDDRSRQWHEKPHYETDPHVSVEPWPCHARELDARLGRRLWRTDGSPDRAVVPRRVAVRP
jgi:hypothetical protein